MKRFLINTPYERCEGLRSFIEDLPESFLQGGNLLWNGRNKIKAYDLPSPYTKGEVVRMVAKRFKRLDPLQKLIYMFRTHKACKAFRNGVELRRRGFDTPMPIAYVECKEGAVITDAYYLCEATTLQSIEGQVDRDDWNKALACDFAHYVAQLHLKGILHHDLNDTNVLYALDSSGRYRFQLIDINRMTFYHDVSEISEWDIIENLTRFTGRMSLFEYVVTQYAVARRLEDPADFVSRAVAQKRRHDLRWRRRKAFFRMFKHKKK